MEGIHWDLGIKKLESDLNTSVSKTTGHTPFEMVYGYIPRFQEGLARQLTEKSEKYRCPEELWAEVKEKIEIEQRASKIRYDISRVKNVAFNAGDISSKPENTGKSTKLQPRRVGPLVVTETIPSDTYRVQSLVSRGKGSRINTTAHVNQLRIWRGFSDDSDCESDCESENEMTDEIDDTNENESGQLLDNVNDNDVVINSNVNITKDQSKSVKLRQSTKQQRLPARLQNM